MPLVVTPEELGRKLGKVATAVQQQDKLAITARATVTKNIITTAAQSSGGLGRKFGRKWIKADVTGNDSATVRLTSGFGFLAELGSYKASGSGWDEYPKAGGQALNTPYGFFAKVDHPPLAAHPFFERGVEAARKPGQEAYAKTMRDAIAKAIR